VAQRTALDIIRNPGRLVADPTDLSTDYPHGGTALGETHSREFSDEVILREIRGEAFGSSTIEYVQAGEQVFLAGIAVGYDNDMLGKLFLNTATGSSSGRTKITYPGSNLEGSRLSDKGFVLLFSPNDTTQPGIILYNALPMVNPAHRISMALSKQQDFGFFFRGIRNTTNNLVWDMAMLEDITLP